MNRAVATDRVYWLDYHERTRRRFRLAGDQDQRHRRWRSLHAQRIQNLHHQRPECRPLVGRARLSDLLIIELRRWGAVLASEVGDEFFG